MLLKKQNLRNYGKSIGAKYTLTDNNENFGYTNVTDQIAYMKRLYEITKDTKRFLIIEYSLFK